MPALTLVVACARDGAIGNKGALPWNIPEDMAHFKRLTMGHAVIMGRKTWESIPFKYRPLSGRTNIVLTRTYSNTRFDHGTAPMVHVSSSLWMVGDMDVALHVARDDANDSEPMVIGGASIYNAALPMATRIEMTVIDRDVEADTFFHFDAAVWKPVLRIQAVTPGVSFVTLERAKS